MCRLIRKRDVWKGKKGRHGVAMVNLWIIVMDYEGLRPRKQKQNIVLWSLPVVQQLESRNYLYGVPLLLSAYISFSTFIYVSRSYPALSLAGIAYNKRGRYTRLLVDG